MTDTERQIWITAFACTKGNHAERAAEAWRAVDAMRRAHTLTTSSVQRYLGIDAGAAAQTIDFISEMRDVIEAEGYL